MEKYIAQPLMNKVLDLLKRHIETRLDQPHWHHPLVKVSWQKKMSVPENYFDPHPGFALTNGTSTPRISYIHEPTVGYFHFGAGHPMKPYRLALTHDLVMHYGLNEHMAMHRGHSATLGQLSRFHSDEYLDFLLKSTSIQSPQAAKSAILKLIKSGASSTDPSDPGRTLMSRFNIGEDCPIFEGLYDFCSLYTGSSLIAGQQIIQGTADIAINWSGGLHHAKRSEASGFCYINDIVLVILDLLMHYPRVLYIDIDVHHGDGVQEAFYNNDRVMCFSLHKYGDLFFPGTGALEEIGVSRGLGFSVNVPFLSGIDDASYQYVFRPVMESIIECFDPSVIVLQCGADSLAGDRLGVFNLSIQGHGACVSFVKSLGRPLVVLGGGGYTIRNVSRCWAYETSVLTSTMLPNDLPRTSPHLEYWAPDYTLLSFSSNVKPPENENSRSYLDSIISTLKNNLREKCKGAPSVQLQYFPVSDFDSDLEPDSDEDKSPDDENLKNIFLKF